MGFILFKHLIIMFCNCHNKQNNGLNTVTSFSRLQGNTSLSIQWNMKRKAWKAHKRLHLHARSGHGWHSFFIFLFLILVPHCGSKPNPSGHVWHLKKVNLPASDSTLFLLYLHVPASTWEKWERNTVDVVYITNPLTSTTLSVT